MVDAYKGKWKLTESENFDEYLKALGVGFVLRKMANTAKPVLEFIIDGDDITMVSHSVKTVTTGPFKLGVEFTNARADGQTVPTTITLDGGKLIESMGGDKPTTITREIQGDKLVTNCVCDGVRCHREFARKKQPMAVNN